MQHTRAFCAAIFAWLSLSCAVSGQVPNGGGMAVPNTALPYGVTCNAVSSGADPSGILDSSTAINACASRSVATGGNVNIYLPSGKYYLANPVTLSGGQCLYGDGRGNTTLTVDQGFSSSATGIIVLNGREQQGPCVSDIDIEFTQPSTQNSRANFLTLGSCTSGNGGTGCKYPPAIYVSNSNRFRISRIRIARAWDGIINAAGNSTGGYFLSDIEISAFDIGLLLDQTFDFGHVSRIHFWDFDLSTSLQTVFNDGNTIAARFGSTGTVGGNSGEVDGISVEDFTTFAGRVQIQNTNSWLHFANLMLDTGATLEIVADQWLQISNIYQTGTPLGSNTNCPIQISGGNNFIHNYRSTGSVTSICETAGSSLFNGGYLAPVTTSTSAASQSGGRLAIRNFMFAPNTGAGAWTVPLINNTAGTLQIQDNMFVTSPGDVGAVVIATDNAENLVTGNTFNGWSFTPPSGTAGVYYPNSSPIAQSNVAMGPGALRSAAPGLANATAVGGSALAANTTGVQNTAFGFGTLSHVVSSTNNSAFGSTACNQVAGGGGNTCLGQGSGAAIVGGSNNTVVGNATGNKLTSGGSNSIFGSGVASTTLTSGTGNILIGTSSAVDTPASGTTNLINIGNAIYAGNGVAAPVALTLTAGAWGLGKMTASGSAPGAGGAKIELVCGTNAGTAKLIAYAGTSTTATTILDNIGSGVTGC